MTYLTNAETIYKNFQYEYALDRLLSLPIDIEIPPFSQTAAESRYIPPGVSDYYGMFDPDMVPHMVEILNRLHPDDPCTQVTLMKSVQSAGTTTVIENCMLNVIRHKLGSMLFLISTKGQGAVRISANIDTMIDNSGLSEYVKPASNRTGKKSKDGSFYKEFVGGIKLLVSSYNSISDLKSNTFHYIFEDELDEAGAELKDQGDIEKIIEGRTLGLLKYKIVQVSTSSRAETSRIYRNFLAGDQNEYFVPCPLCGEKQILTLKGKGEKFGLTFKREKRNNAGKKVLIPESVEYICEHCEKAFNDTKKQWMLQNGLWIPQNIPDDSKKVSYHAPGFISPFLPWERICQAFIDTDFGQDILKFKDFTINYMGNPWMAVKKSAKWQMLKERAEDYTMGTVPPGKEMVISGVTVYDGPLVLFAGIDVQGDRLEMCITGFGINGNKWIVDYQIFYGKTENIEDPCWLALHNWSYEKEYKVCGQSMTISYCAIDAGFNPKAGDKRKKDYANKAHVVYDFVAMRTDKFMAIMGTPDDKAIGILKESKITDTVTNLTKRYMVSVSLLKESIMNVIENTEGYNTIHVPEWAVYEGEKRENSDEFFMQFLSERFQEDPKKPGTWKWMKIRNRNEVLDVFIYSWAAATFMNVTSWTMEAWSEYYYSLVEGE